MSTFAVTLFGDSETYYVDSQDEAEELIEKSDNGGDWVELIPLEFLEDLI